MYHAAIADIHGYMIHGTILGIEDQIALLQLTFADRAPLVDLRAGIMTQIYTKFFIDLHSKARAVHAIRQALTAPYVRVTNELQCIIYNLATQRLLLLCFDLFLCIRNRMA